MNNHYYQKNQDNLKSEPKIINFSFKENNYQFHTDNGVFSKQFIDYGSKSLIEAFKPNDLAGDILDMGAGYGPIGIVLSKTYSKCVHMCEINTRAFELLQKNIKINFVNAVAYHSDLYQALPKDLLFASIVTNPPIRAGKDIVFAIYSGAYSHLMVGGELWVVIQKKQGAPSSKKYIEDIFGNCEIVNRDKGYYILKAVK